MPAPAAAAGHPPLAAAARQWLRATPGRIALCLVATVLSLLLAAAANLHAAAAAADAIRTVGADAEPSVVLALRIGATLADMDDAAADDALGGGFSATGTSQRWRTDKATLDALLVQSSRNVTYAAEVTALQALLRWTGEYHASLAEVRGATDPAHPFFATQRLQWSHRLLTAFTQPEAAALAAANRAPLEDAYRAYNGYAFAAGLLGLATALLVVAVLAAVQVFLWRRTHRVLSPPLALATLLAAGLAAGLLTATLREHASIRSAKADSYDSLDPLFAAKGLAAAMGGDLSYWMLDPATRPTQAATLDTHARALLDVDVHDPATAARLRTSLANAQRLEQDGHPADALAAVPPMAGLLGKEFANITFGPPERDGASDAVRALLDAVAAADRVRALAPTRMADALQHRNAEATPALAALEAALDRTIAVNQAQFDASIGEARALVGWTPAALNGTLALIALLTAAGLWPRYREYL